MKKVIQDYIQIFLCISQTRQIGYTTTLCEMAKKNEN